MFNFTDYYHVTNGSIARDNSTDEEPSSKAFDYNTSATFELSTTTPGMSDVFTTEDQSDISSGLYGNVNNVSGSTVSYALSTEARLDVGQDMNGTYEDTGITTQAEGLVRKKRNTLVNMKTLSKKLKVKEHSKHNRGKSELKEDDGINRIAKAGKKFKRRAFKWRVLKHNLDNSQKNSQFREVITKYGMDEKGPNIEKTERKARMRGHSIGRGHRRLTRRQKRTLNMILYDGAIGPLIFVAGKKYI